MRYNINFQSNNTLWILLLRPLLSLILLIVLSCNLYASQKNPIDSLEFSNPILKDKALQPRTRAFERLEFLGDRVFGLVTAHLLYKCYPSKNIGWLDQVYASLVSRPSLAQMYEGFGINPIVLYSSSYQPPLTGLIAEKTASDIVEAVMGALYIDQKFKTAQHWGETLIRTYYDLDDVDDKYTSPKLPVRVLSSTYMATFIRNRGLETLQNILSYQFKNSRLLFEAFYHSSMGGDSFKKLNYLGTRVLALVMAQKVYFDYPDMKEGYLKQQFETFIKNDNVERVFQSWKMDRYLARQDPGLLSLLLEPDHVPLRMAVDAVRSFIAAVYLDGGWESATEVTSQLFFMECPQDLIKLSVKSFEHKALHSEKHTEILDNEDKSSDQSEEVSDDADSALEEKWPSLGKSVPSDLLTSQLSPKRQPSQKSYLKVLESAKPTPPILPVQKDNKAKEEWPALSSQQRTTKSPYEESALKLSLDYASLIHRNMQQTNKKSTKHITQSKQSTQQEPWPPLSSRQSFAKSSEKSVTKTAAKNLSKNQ